jgi:hypothetical protein
MSQLSFIRHHVRVGLESGPRQNRLHCPIKGTLSQNATTTFMKHNCKLAIQIIISRISGGTILADGIQMIPPTISPNRRCSGRWSIVLTTLILGFLLFWFYPGRTVLLRFCGFIELRNFDLEGWFTVRLQPRNLIGEELEERVVDHEALKYLCIDSSPDRSHRRLRTFQRSYRKEFCDYSCSAPGIWMYNPHSSGREEYLLVLKRQRNKVWIWRPFMKELDILILNPLGCIVTEIVHDEKFLGSMSLFPSLPVRVSSSRWALAETGYTNREFSQRILRG